MRVERISLTNPTDLRGIAEDNGINNRLMLIINPTSGQGRIKSARKQIISRLSTLGDLEVVETEKTGDAKSAAARAAESGVGSVIVAGGDGTLNEVIQAIAGSQTALGLIPQGTANVLARELGLPLDDVDMSCDIIQSGAVSAIDLGLADSRYFATMVGVGFDAAVVQRVDPQVKDILGPAAYGFAGLSELVRHKASHFRLKIDDQRYETMASLVVVANVASYAMNVKIARHAVCNDGWLDVCIIEKGGSDKITLLKHAAQAFLQGVLPEDAHVQCLRAEHVSVDTSPEVLVQIDGDTVGQTPIDVQVVPGALRIITNGSLSV